MKQMSIMIDLERCIGCKTCIVACRNGKGLIDHGEALPNQLPGYLRVEEKVTGVYPDLSLNSWIVPCQHCSDPDCLSACQHGAIEKDPQSGVVQIDPEKCTGCEYNEKMGSDNKLLPSPCMLSCPAGANVQGYVQLIKQGRYEDAVKLIMKRVPLPGVLGRVCPHPCEEACKRAEVDEAVSIRELKRAAADSVDFSALDIPRIVETGVKVAVIGSGPAGLTAAYDLRLKGHAVTIFEALDVLGGMLRVGIPDFRLPKEVVDREIGYLLRHGIEARTGVRFGKDINLESLADEGYTAVLLGVGMHSGKKLNIPGSDSKGMVDALEFLRKVNLGEREPLEPTVVVIGGGDTAVDAARTAKRVGAAEVTLLYRRTENEMPAYRDEVAAARDEGVNIMELAIPLEILVKDGRVAGLGCMRCELGRPDESGRPRPEPVPGSEFTVECGTVIAAIGQTMDTAWSSGKTEISTSAGNTFAVTDQLQTALPHVFAAGDAATGPATVIKAIADGHRAAEAMDRFVQGMPVVPELAVTRATSVAQEYGWRPIPAGIYQPAARQMAKYLKPADRITGFLEECSGLKENQVVAEAERCLNCGCACMNSCSYDVIQFDNKSGVSHKCNMCYERFTTGQLPVCVDVCLTDALSFGERELLKQSALDKGRHIVGELSEAGHIYIK